MKNVGSKFSRIWIPTALVYKRQNGEDAIRVGVAQFA